MGFSPEYRAATEGKLAAVVPIRSRVMFGGIGIYSDDLLFALIDDDKLYFKVDSSNRADFEARGMEPFYPYEGAKPMGYYELPTGLIDDPIELQTWIVKSKSVAAGKKKK
jgi:DNA transformation protein